ncbi:MAG: hypothetical protein ABSF97_04240 [Candidatus Sulfotelmatobacter sp.]|jgi:hypothetical protein
MRFVIRLLLITIPLSPLLLGQNISFQGIAVGEALSALPIQCSAADVYCEGVVAGSFIRVLTSDNRVLDFDVMYAGTTLSRQAIKVAPIDLARALKVHSLQSGALIPVLRYAVGIDGKAYGIVDLANRIVYHTESAPSMSQMSNNGVTSVSYVNDKAPVLKKGEPLGSAEAPLLTDARRSDLPSSRPGSLGSDGTAPQSESRLAEYRIEPFGLRPGMTWDQVLSVVGSASLKHAKDNVYILTTVPKPHPDFDEYVLLFFPPKGLVKMMAYSKKIQTNGWGQEVGSKFEEVYGAMSSKYGSGKKLDFLRSGSLWEAPQYWMMGLLKDERTLAAYWDPTPDARVTLISLTAKALAQDEGQLVLMYEFDGFSEYSKAQENKKKDVF